MTYAASGIYSQDYKGIGVIYPDNRAVGIDGSILQEEYKRSVEHFFLPVSTQWSNPLLRFLSLKKKWEANTAHLSSMTEMAIHPAYQQIIGMGSVAVPLILQELKKQPGHWFWALKSITGEDPVLPEHRGRIRQMTEAWLRWGEKHGYL